MADHPKSSPSDTSSADTASIILSPYDARWPRQAASLLMDLRKQLGPGVVQADHIGSTSVPGMAAKNILDLQLSVLNLEEAVTSFGPPLGAMGFVRLPYNKDHVPAGRPDPVALWAKRFWHRRGHPDGDVNLHIRLVGSPNERLALIFRDWLRAHPEAVHAYAAFKRTLANSVVDLDAYTVVKDPVVDLIASVAEKWSEETQWEPHS